MTVTWKIDNLQYYLSKDSKDKVVYKVSYTVSGSKTVEDKEYYAVNSTSVKLDVETVEAVEAKDAVLYTDKDTLLAVFW